MVEIGNLKKRLLLILSISTAISVGAVTTHLSAKQSSWVIHSAGLSVARNDAIGSARQLVEAALDRVGGIERARRVHFIKTTERRIQFHVYDSEHNVPPFAPDFSDAEEMVDLQTPASKTTTRTAAATGSKSQTTLVYRAGRSSRTSVFDDKEFPASTLKTDHTLYLVSFDYQPGLRIQSVFKVLAARINKYSGRVSDSAWVSALEAIKDPGFPRDAEDKTRVLTAIDQMEQDIKSITAKVHKQFPSVAHAEALELLPQNLRNTVSLYGKRDQYSRQRDAINAGFISTMHDHLPSPGKLIVWAHHNHLTYGFSTAGMGRALHERWGNQMYSIGAFAESGQYYDFLDEETPAPADLSEPEPNTVDAYLAGLSNQNYFLDLSTLPEATNNPLFTRSTIRVEAKPWPATLAEDYDGIILIKKIHRPSFRAGFLGILGMDAVFLLRTYWYVAFVLLVLLTVLIYRKLLAIRKRRLSARQRSLANP